MTTRGPSKDGHNKAAHGSVSAHGTEYRPVRASRATLPPPAEGSREMTEVEVLNLVAKADSPPYRKQVAGLESLGVDTTTLPVPGGDGDGRSLHHYARFQARTLQATRESYDLVHANYGLTVPSALLQPTRPVVLSLWGSDLMGQYGWLCRRCARRCDAVVVMSEEMAALPDCPCHVIPHGIDLTVFRPWPRREARETVGWAQDTRHVLFPYSPERGLKDYPRARRVVDAVDGRFPEPVELHYIIGVDHDEVPTYMNAADALLLTSRREGSPNVVKEALACDVPVVSTDVSDVRDRLADVSPSAVCGSDDELVTALVEVLDRDERSNGRETVEHLGQRRMCRYLLDVYEQVLQEGRKQEYLNPLAERDSASGRTVGGPST